VTEEGESVLAEDGAEYPELQATAGASAEHLLRLGRLVEHQADQLDAAEAGLREITALCDLAEWAAEGTGNGSPPVVLVDDLRRLLARRRNAGPTGPRPA
jgi:hypothetical protein